jgi:hypothetical protein
MRAIYDGIRGPYLYLVEGGVLNCDGPMDPGRAERIVAACEDVWAHVKDSVPDHHPSPSDVLRS